MLTKIKGLFSVKGFVSNKVFYSYFSNDLKSNINKNIEKKSKHYVTKIEGIYIKENMEQKNMYIPHTSKSGYYSNSEFESSIPIGNKQYMFKEIFITSN